MASIGQSGLPRMIAILKIVAATLVFAGFLYLIKFARGKAAMAGGMLLTFPAVNGLTLLFAGTPGARVMSETMLPMIAFNGFMCLGFILAFSSLQRSTRLRTHPDAARWCLVVTCAAIWMVVALLQIPIPRSYQVYFASAYFVVAAASTISATSNERATAQTPATASLRQVRIRSAIRLLFFIATFSAVLIFASLGWGGFAGALGAAPLLPLFGLFVLSEGDSLSTLQTVGRTVLPGAVVAMTFVMAFSSVVDPAHPLRGFALLLSGWALCLLVIWLASAVVLPRAGRVISRSAD